MGKTRSGATRKQNLVAQSHTDLKQLERASWQAEVEHELHNRTCSCPPWQSHRDNCPINTVLTDDSNQLSVLERIERKVENRIKLEKILAEITEVERKLAKTELSKAKSEASDSAAPLEATLAQPV